MKNVIIGILINNNREITVMWYVVVPYTGGYQLTLTIIIIIIAECSSTVPIILIMPPRGIDTPLEWTVWSESLRDQGVN